MEIEKKENDEELTKQIERKLRNEKEKKRKCGNQAK